MRIKEAQRMMKELYYERDKRRGIERTFMWMVEEVGELSEAIMSGDEEKISEEFADLIAWMFSLANVLQVDVEEVFLSKYDWKCPKCRENPCVCSEG